MRHATHWVGHSKFSQRSYFQVLKMKVRKMTSRVLPLECNYVEIVLYNWSELFGETTNLPLYIGYIFFLSQKWIPVFMPSTLRPKYTSRWLEDKAKGWNKDLGALQFSANICCIGASLLRCFSGHPYSNVVVRRRADFVNVVEKCFCVHFMDASNSKHIHNEKVMDAGFREYSFESLRPFSERLSWR